MNVQGSGESELREMYGAALWRRNRQRYRSLKDYHPLRRRGNRAAYAWKWGAFLVYSVGLSYVCSEQDSILRHSMYKHIRGVK